jgi:hypothetical protein
MKLFEKLINRVVRKEIMVLQKDGKISCIGRVKMKYYVESRGEQGTSYTQQNAGRLNEFFTPCVGTACQNTLLKER